MIGIIIALIAQVLIAISLVIDKSLLKEKRAGNVFAYVFWIGLFNFFAIFLAPFDFAMPSLKVAIMAFLAGVLSLVALIFYYKALQIGEASETLAILGGFTPVATIIMSGIFLKSSLNPIQMFFFIILTAGGFIMFLADKRKFRKTILWILLVAICFGSANVFQKAGYVGSSFLTGYAIMKMGTFLTTMSLLLVPSWRRQIFNRTKETPNPRKLLYLSNRAMAGIGSFALSYAIKLGHPAIVEATSALKYAMIFIITLLLTVFWPRILKENFRKWVLAAKIIATILIIGGILGLVTQQYYETMPQIADEDITWGISFSQKMSSSFGMNWRDNYKAIVEDLKPRGLRLVAYWDLIEPNNGKYNFADLDWQMKEAELHNIPVILTIGQKVPRWPECHYPAWIDVKNEEQRETKLLDYEKQVVLRYRNQKNLLYWQVENEPYIHFGVCPTTDKKFLRQEVANVEALDKTHPVLMTDGGEWGRWYTSAKMANVFGSTLYRKTYNKNVGSTNPPLTPEYYHIKSDVIKYLTGKTNEKFIISELGLEPWWSKQVYELSQSEQTEIFTNTDFNNFIKFAKKTNFDTVYMWGAEWWYYMKINGNDSYWRQAQSVIRSGK